MSSSKMYPSVQKYFEKWDRSVCRVCKKKSECAYLPNKKAKASMMYWLCKECAENQDPEKQSVAVPIVGMTNLKTCIDKIKDIIFSSSKSQKESEITKDLIVSHTSLDNLFSEFKSEVNSKPSNLSLEEDCHKRKHESLDSHKNKKKCIRRHGFEKSDNTGKIYAKHRIEKVQIFVPRKVTSKSNKINNKGATCLHKLCVRGRIDEIRKCLCEGANPNTRDFSGETPLSEAVRRNELPIAKLLLEAGACVNTPAWRHGTPLLDAVHNDNLEMVDLLLKYGADVNARAVTNATAKSCTNSQDMEELLKKAPVVVLLPEIVPKIPQNKIVLTCCGLNTDEVENTLNLCILLNIAFYKNVTAEVSHLVVKDAKSKNIEASVDVLKALAAGAVIVNYTWVLCSIKSKELVEVEEFEIHGTTEYPDTHAPKKSRINRAFLMPGLFERCSMALTKVWCQSSHISKDVQELITLSGALLLKREPDPDGSCLEDTVMVHIRDENSPLYETTHIILYPDEKHQKLKYNMKHVKSLPLSWFLKCIQTCTVHDVLDDYFR